MVGPKVVITGGILRDGSLIVDVVIVDLASMSVSRCGHEKLSHHFCHQYDAECMAPDHTTHLESVYSSLCHVQNLHTEVCTYAG